MRTPESVARRADRLVRCYPGAWRERYAEEYAELLIDELTDGGWSVRRELDVVAHGAWTRLAYAGLVGAVAGHAHRTRAMLGALAAVAGLFTLLAVGVWSELTVGWQWSAPANAGTREAIALMSVAVIGLGAIAALLVLPVVVRVIARCLTGATVIPWRPGLSGCVAAAILIIGTGHFGSHWPGSVGHPWPGRALVPAWMARFGWAGTLWISAYWAHPGALRSFPAGEVAWMLISPVAWIALVGSGLALVRHVGLTPRLARWTVAMFTALTAVMGVFLIGALLWLFSGGSGPRNMFAVGTIDLAIITVLGGGLITATQLIRRVPSAATSSARG